MLAWQVQARKNYQRKGEAARDLEKGISLQEKGNIRQGRSRMPVGRVELVAPRGRCRYTVPTSFSYFSASPPAAVKAIRRSIAAEPSCARAHFHLATCLSEMGLQHFDDAIVSYRTAIMLSSAARDDLLVEVLTDFVSHSSRHLLRIVTSFTLDLT